MILIAVPLLIDIKIILFLFHFDYRLSLVPWVVLKDLEFFNYDEVEYGLADENLDWFDQEQVMMDTYLNLSCNFAGIAKDIIKFMLKRSYL